MSESLPPGADHAGPASPHDAGPAEAAAAGASPFARCPRGGREPLGRIRGRNACREYDRQLHRPIGERCCACRGLRFCGSYGTRLLLQVDQVVPTGMARLLGIPPGFFEDALDRVLACAGRNGFGNRSVAIAEPRADWELAASVALRDAAFAIRSARIAARRASEPAVFASERASPSAPDETATQAS